MKMNEDKIPEEILEDEKTLDKALDNKIEELKADRHAWKKKDLTDLAQRQVVFMPNNGQNRAQRRKKY